MTDAVEGRPRAGAWSRSMEPDGDGRGDPAGAARRLRAGRRGLLLLLPWLLGACGMLSGGGGGTPPQKEPTRLDISIGAGTDLNTDAKGRGAPLLLRVFELKFDTAFQEAEFFALQDNPKAVLGPDLLAVDQFIVRPGETREIRRPSHPETTAIGVFAGYRDLPHAVWRVVHRMPPAPDAGWYRAVIPAHKVALRVDLQANAILVTDREAGQRPTRFASESLKGLDPGPSEATAQPAGAGVQAPDLPDLPAIRTPRVPEGAAGSAGGIVPLPRR